MQQAILQTRSLVGPESTRRAHSINDTGAPRRTARTNKKQIDQIHEIIDYLDVEEAQRYLPQETSTYCNIYAHDYAFLCGTYVPRVWWNSDAIKQIVAGLEVEESYGKSVFELNANALHDWFEEFGGEFNWKRAKDVMELQSRADAGSVCMIVARRRNRGRSGHIAAVAPRTKGYSSDIWPVESQAGSINYQYHIKQSPWWTKQKFDSHGFWHHD